MVDKCTVVKIPPTWGIKREPTRPPELRCDYFGGMTFNDNYDWHNLWYDAIYYQNTILLIGPPLNNLTNGFEKDKLTTLDGKVLTVTAHNANRMSLAVVDADAKEIKFESGITITCNDVCNDFDNKICMFTLQKNNPISWIKQWIDYHVTLGINSFLIYDNNSDLYNTEHLEESIKRPDVTVKIVEWNVPYGPQGIDCDHYDTWDSDYAQSSMFEHAKRRYLTNAKLIINSDIDELLVIDKPIESIIDDLVKENLHGYTYKGRWIEPYDIANKISASEVPFDRRYFCNYYCTDSTNPRGIGDKWLMIPNKAISCQWSVHITNADMIQNNNIYYAHYLAMNTNWSYKRDRYDRNSKNLVVDIKLLHNLSKLRSGV